MKTNNNKLNIIFIGLFIFFTVWIYGCDSCESHEITSGGKEEKKQGRSYNSKKKKIVGAVELTENGKIKRFYATIIKDFSSKSLTPFFEKFISENAKIKTDNWRGYKPLMANYKINQSISNNGRNMPQIHIIIHQVKSWIRTIYSWVHPKHLNSYLNEFSFRLNRAIFKDFIFHKMIERVVFGQHLTYKQIIVLK